MIDEERKTAYMNRNIKIFPTYLALTWDVIFVWTISLLFFTNQKGLSYSQAVMLDSYLMIFGALFCVPVTKIFQNAKHVTATQCGLIGYGLYLLLCIFGTHYITFICAEVCLGFGYVACGIKANRILTDSLSLVNRDREYQKIFGKGMSFLYTLEAVGAILITYVYSWKPYACYWLSFSIVIIALVLSLFIKDPTNFQEKESDETEPNTAKTKPDSYGKILSSMFLIFVLLYMFMYRGVLSVVGSNFKIYLQEMTNAGRLPLWAFGYLYAGQKLGSAITSKYQFKFNIKFGVKSLVIFNSWIVISFLTCGILYIINPTNIFFMIIIIILSFVEGSLRIPNQIFVNNYMQTCIPRRNIDKAYALRTMAEYAGFAVINTLYATLLGVFNDNYGLTNLVYIAIVVLPLVLTLVFFIRSLIKKYAKRYTIVKDEYTKWDRNKKMDK